MKFIDSKLHGIIDYLFVVFLLSSPAIFNLTGFVASYVYILAGIAFLYSISTDYELGLFSVISFPLHGIIDLILGIIIVVSPWVFGFSDSEADRNFFLVIGFVVLLVFTFSKFRNQGKVQNRTV